MIAPSPVRFISYHWQSPACQGRPLERASAGDRPHTLDAFDDGEIETDQACGRAGRPLLHQVEGVQQSSLVVWHETDTGDNLSEAAGSGAHVTG